MNRKLFGLLFILTTLTLSAEDTLKPPYFSIKMLENPEDVKVSESVYKLLSVTDPEALSKNEKEKFAALKNAYLKHEERKKSWYPRKKSVAIVCGCSLEYRLIPVIFSVCYFFPTLLKTQEDVALKEVAKLVNSEKSLGNKEAGSELKLALNSSMQRELGWCPDRKSIILAIPHILYIGLIIASVMANPE